MIRAENTSIIKAVRQKMKTSIIGRKKKLNIRTSDQDAYPSFW